MLQNRADQKPSVVSLRRESPIRKLRKCTGESALARRAVRPHSVGVVAFPRELGTRRSNEEEDDEEEEHRTKERWQAGLLSPGAWASRAQTATCFSASCPTSATYPLAGEYALSPCSDSSSALPSSREGRMGTTRLSTLRMTTVTIRE